MTILGHVVVSGVGITILTVGAVALLVGFAAWAVAIGRRTDAALDNAFTTRSGRLAQTQFSVHPSQSAR
jgi:hypothetical protein